MKEDFLHFLWQFQYYNQHDLHSTSGQKIQIVEIGQINPNAGADFLMSKVLIDNVEWIGNIEIHIKSSNWDNHQHQKDNNYNNVILHIVWEDDKTIKRADESIIPTLELKNRTSEKLLYQYQNLINNKDIIPCASQFSNVNDLKKIMMLDKALIKRLEDKALIIKKLWLKNQQNWEETTYQILAKNFGFKINAEPFLQLAQSLPLKVLLKHRNSLTQIEALVFGQAGFLGNDDCEDDYFKILKKEYVFLSKKYSLESRKLLLTQWQFARLRPANFPTLRLAQLASLLYQYVNIFALFLKSSPKELKLNLQIQPSKYWQSHYQFGKQSKSVLFKLGKSSIENIFINTIAPLCAFFALEKGQEEYMEKAIQVLESIKAEDNKILRLWENLDLKVRTAFDSQALIELYNNFCTPKKCLRCSIGLDLLNKNE